jgi:hypothetical protein
MPYFTFPRIRPCFILRESEQQSISTCCYEYADKGQNMFLKTYNLILEFFHFRLLNQSLKKWSVILTRQLHGLYFNVPLFNVLVLKLHNLKCLLPVHEMRHWPLFAFKNLRGSHKLHYNVQVNLIVS